IKGVEAHVSWRPNPNWTFDLTGNYVQAELVDVAPNLQLTPYTTGHRLPSTAPYVIATSVERALNVGGKNGYARLDYSRTGPLEYRQQGVEVQSSDVIQYLNLSTAIEWNETLSVGFSATNLLN